MLVILFLRYGEGQDQLHLYRRDARSQSHNTNDDNIFDQFMISLTDNEGKVTNKPLTVWIADTEPNANNDVVNDQ